MTNLIVDLPTPLSVAILADLLEDQDVARLDCAFCSVSQRNLFLELLCDDGCEWYNRLLGHPYCKDTMKVEACMRWCVSRKVRISDFWWTAHSQTIDKKLVSEFLQLIYKDLDALSVGNVDAECFIGGLQLPGFENLTFLNWDHRIGGRSTELAALLARTPQLEELHINSDNALVESDFEGIQLNSLRLLSPTGKLGRENLSWFTRKCPNVVEFLYYPGREVLNPIAAIVPLPLLQELSLMERTASDAELVCIADSCPLLYDVRIDYAYDVTDAGIAYLCSHCMHICTLHGLGGDYMTSTSLRTISLYLSSTLKELSLSWSSYVLDHLQLTPLPQLQTLDISSCCFLDSPAIDLVPLFMSCPSVRDFCINCMRISDATLQALATHCQKLKILSMTTCPGHTQAGLFAQLPRMPLLSKLSITERGYSEELRALLQEQNCELVVKPYDPEWDE